MLFPRMEENKGDHMFQDSWFQYEDHHIKNHSDHHDGKYASSSTSSSVGEDSSMVSNGSSISSSDTRDDASSSASSSLHDLSDIMAELPIKRGLSKFYQGKSESFTSLSRVTSVEDLAKKAIPQRRNLKASKSCGNGLNSYKNYTLPKAVISKKTTRGPSFSSFMSRKGSFMSSKPPLTPLQKNLEC